MIRPICEFLKIPEGRPIPVVGKYWLRMLHKIVLWDIKRAKLPENPLNAEKREEIVTASLTSFPARIEYVFLAIKSLMLQTYKPDKILLYLAKEQFEDKKLPSELLALEKYGLQIIWMHDINSHKKYFYSVINQKENEVVITFDDDIIYAPNCIERLMKTHKKYPNVLVCERGHTVAYRKNGELILNPGRWPLASNIGVKNPTYSMTPSAGSGCLIPKGAFFEDVCNEEIIRKKANKNDDLWYMFMCAQNKTRMIKTHKYNRPFTLIEGSQKEQLATENIINNKSEIVVEVLKNSYPDAWRRIITDQD